MEADAYVSPQAALAGAYNSQGALTRVVRVTTSTPYYFNVETWIPSGTANYGLMRFSAVRIGTN